MASAVQGGGGSSPDPQRHRGCAAGAPPLPRRRPRSRCRASWRRRWRRGPGQGTGTASPQQATMLATQPDKQQHQRRGRDDAGPSWHRSRGDLRLPVPTPEAPRLRGGGSHRRSEGGRRVADRGRGRHGRAEAGRGGTRLRGGRLLPGVRRWRGWVDAVRKIRVGTWFHASTPSGSKPKDPSAAVRNAWNRM